ncbi:MAG: transposase [Gemmataceae bacterium]
MTPCAGKRQVAVPQRSAQLKPKTPGRKAGEQHGTHGHRPPPPPDQIHERHEAKLPDACPHCHEKTLVETGTAEQFQTEIPRTPIHRRFTSTSVAADAAARPFKAGIRCKPRTPSAPPPANSEATPCRRHRTAYAIWAVARQGRDRFRLALRHQAHQRASCQIGLRMAAKLEPDYKLILDDLKASTMIVPDETGWRIGGQPAWLHVGVGDRVTAYTIDSQRSAEVLERIIGADWSGILTHDGFASYDRFEQAIHQQCVGHVPRRPRPARDGRPRRRPLPQRVIALFTEAVHLRNEYHRGHATLEHLENQREVFDDRLRKLASVPRAVPAYQTFANHLMNHFEQWFAFVVEPKIEPTNWKAEQAIRPAVVNARSAATAPQPVRRPRVS